MYPLIKRGIDFIIALLCILIFMPLYIILFLMIHLESKGSAIFKQKRIGKDKKPFYILKFRTMYTDTPKDVPTHLLSDPTRYITKTGAFLRKTSLDELPQLFNVLKGEMSLVGPRPALWNQYDLIEKRDENKANTLLPGITGYAQVNGRDELPIDIKASYDGEYVRKMSLWFDVKIICLTIQQVLHAKGVKEGAQKQ